MPDLPTPLLRRPVIGARNVALSGLLAALLAVSAWLALPLGAVPFTLQTFVLALIVLVTGPANAAFAVGAYLALGAAGLPVFAGARGGIAVLTGPTGGYLLGFWLGAVAGSYARARLARPTVLADAVALLIMLAGIYVPGAAWLAVSTGRPAAEAVVVGVLPFIGPDAFKTCLAAVVAPSVRRVSSVVRPRQ